MYLHTTGNFNKLIANYELVQCGHFNMELCVCFIISGFTSMERDMLWDEGSVWLSGSVMRHLLLTTRLTLHNLIKILSLDCSFFSEMSNAYDISEKTSSIIPKFLLDWTLLTQIYSYHGECTWDFIIWWRRGGGRVWWLGLCSSEGLRWYPSTFHLFRMSEVV